MNEKWKYTLHEYYYVYGDLYSRLYSKRVNIDSTWLLLHIKTKLQIKAETNPHKMSRLQVVFFLR